MSAPGLWIFTPIILGGLLVFVGEKRITANLGSLISFLLALAAFFIPIDQALSITGISFKITSEFQFFGRSLILTSSDAHLLTLLYGMSALWFFGSESAVQTRRLASLGLSFMGLLVASIAVEPFLYAALTIELAVLMAIPILVSTTNPPGRGSVRFLIHQTLAMPFILFAGWLLAGVEASPSDLILTTQATLMLALGLAFLLAIFPLHSWMPLLAEEASPFVYGFILWALPTMTSIFAMGFLDRYSWLRSSPQFVTILHASGIVMVLAGGLWSAFQRDLTRAMAYSAMVEIGMALLAIEIAIQQSPNIFFMLIIPRGVSMAVWVYSLSIIKERYGNTSFSSIQGSMRNFPAASVGIVLANLSVAGLPLLAGFPPRLALLEGLSRISLNSAFWLGLGLAGVLVSAIRTLAVMSMAEEKVAWALRENYTQLINIGGGLILLVVLGLFPQVMYPILQTLPAMFPHLGQ